LALNAPENALLIAVACAKSSLQTPSVIVAVIANIIVWDIETIPDLKGFAAANGHIGKTDDEVRAELGDKFPKHIYHSIICIGALVAHREDGGRWTVDALGAPHVGERSEKELIASIVDRIAALSPQLVTFNGSSFDLPVLRYRAMVHGIAAPGLSLRSYFNRYTEDAVDLCDVLSSFSSQAKATLHELCRVMGLPGKPDGMSGAEVEKYYRDGHIRQIAEYCESDVLNTYRVWLRYELFRGRLSEPDFQASEDQPHGVRQGAQQHQAAPNLPDVTAGRASPGCCPGPAPVKSAISKNQCASWRME
jgi:3'-5' exonuclease